MPASQGGDRLRAACVVAAICVACRGPDGNGAGPPWRVVFDDLPAPLLSAWTAPDGVLYAVGGSASRSLVLRHDSRGWWAMDPGTAQALWWVFGFSSSHLYAVGEGGALAHFNGRYWEVLRAGESYTLFGIWGVSPKDLWAVGGRPAIAGGAPVALRYQSGAWRTVEDGLPASGTLFKVWGTASDNVLLVGDDGLIVRFDGTRLRPEASPVADRLVTVFGSGPADVFAVGGTTGAVFLRSDGSEWREVVPHGGMSSNLLGGAVRGPPGADRWRAVAVGWRGLLAQGDGENIEEVTPLTRDCFHAAAPTAEGFIAVGGDLLAGASRGTILARGTLEAGPIQPWPFPGRSFRPVSAPDGGSGAVDAGADAGLVRLAPGEDCDRDPGGCSPPDECWLLVGPPTRAICTRLCRIAAECGAFGPGACCELPGPQVVTPVCLPAGKGACPGGDGGA